MSDDTDKEVKTERGMEMRESEAMSRVGVSALNSLSVFNGYKDGSAKLFIRDFEEALDLANVSADKYKKFYLKTKLRRISVGWYEMTRDSDQYTNWDSVQPRVKDINKKLINIRQNVEENETI